MTHERSAVDNPDGRRQYPAMRHGLILLLIGLAACSGDPRDYGITGPAAPPPMPVENPADLGGSGLPDATTTYGPSSAPSTGRGRFWNYN
jgi:hypothetical protein